MNKNRYTHYLLIPHGELNEKCPRRLRCVQAGYTVIWAACGGHGTLGTTLLEERSRWRQAYTVYSLTTLVIISLWFLHVDRNVRSYPPAPITFCHASY